MRMLSMAGLVLLLAACGPEVSSGGGKGQPGHEGSRAICRNCGDPGGDVGGGGDTGSDIGGGYGGTTATTGAGSTTGSSSTSGASSGAGSTTGAPLPPPLTRIEQLPRGFTCGLTYWADDFLVTGYCESQPTISYDQVPNHMGGPYDFTWETGPHHDAPNFITEEDGDEGQSITRGFYHQELALDPLMLDDPSLADRLWLPAGTACGFHHTQHDPANLFTHERTCMGFDAAVGCPVGWTPRAIADDQADNGGRWVWCEYQDPHGFCADRSCLPSIPQGLVCGVSLDGTGPGPGCLGVPVASGCPTGWARLGNFDSGRPAGHGVAWCVSPPPAGPGLQPPPPPPPSVTPTAGLPRGLTCGMSHQERWDTYVETWCEGTPTLSGAAAGWARVFDGDWGLGAPDGYYHQELLPGTGVMSSTQGSDRYRLPHGAVCGFHHTFFSPANIATGEHTCLGLDAAVGCPDGWTRRFEHDANAAANTGWAWCEYDDRFSLCKDARCLYTDEAIPRGVTCGLAGSGWTAQASCVDVPRAAGCPLGFYGYGYYDDGRSSGEGLGWCEVPR